MKISCDFRSDNMVKWFYGYIFLCESEVDNNNF